MTTPTFENLRSTLKNLRRRRSTLFLLQQGSLLTIALAILALTATGLAAWLDLDRSGTIALFIVTLLAAAGLLWQFIRVLRLRRYDDRALAHYVEDRIPDF
ncbi:MAG: hypothetical protein ACE37N_14050, partial [Pseudohongiellaceae bacterium]